MRGCAKKLCDENKEIREMENEKKKKKKKGGGQRQLKNEKKPLH